jgi:hypothetical protein
MISPNWRIIQVSFLYTSHHIHCWPHITSLKSQVASLNSHFPTKTLYTFVFSPTSATRAHRPISLIVSLLERLLSSTNLEAFQSALPPNVLRLLSTFTLISSSQHSALEHPLSTCDLRLSTRLNWRYSGFGLRRDIMF